LLNQLQKRQPEIRLSKELLANAFTSSGEAILIKDCLGTILIGSQKVAEFFKCNVEDLPGCNVYEALPHPLAQEIQENDRRVISSGNAESGEETWDLGYEQRTLLASRSPIRDGNGTTVGIITCYTNISPIKQAFLLFEQNQKRFLALTNTCPVGIFECNPFHQLTYVNPEWERITGLMPAEAIGRIWTDFISPDQQDLVKRLLGNDDSQPGGDRVDCTLIGRHTCTVELSLNRVSDAESYTVSYIGSVVDLTDRLAAQKELREKSNLLRDLTRSVPAIIWQLAENGDCVFVSDYFETVTGVPIETVLGRSWGRIIHPDDVHDSTASLEAVLSRQSQSSSYEFRIKGRAGDWRWMLTNCQAIYSPDGKFMGIAGHTIDITDRRQAELELLQYNTILEDRVNERTKELVNVNQSLRKEIENRQIAEEQLEEKRAEVFHFSRVSVMGHLSGELAHELNQPLNAIQNYVSSLSQILASAPVPDSTNYVLSKLSGEITRAAKIIRRTREFLSTAKHKPELLSISELVSDSASMLKGEARRRGMTIQVVELFKGAKVLGDPVRLQQVLVNLVLNALEAMVDQPSSTKTATIEIRESEERLLIDIRDTGCGVKPSQREHLFDAFYTTKPTGLGMGLAISRGIVEDHGGTLNHVPRESVGSSFVIDLPIAVGT